MPAIDRFSMHPSASIWQGDCPVIRCEKSFSIEADPWQEKISVLTAFSDHLDPNRAHTHGEFVVYDDLIHGGE